MVMDLLLYFAIPVATILLSIVWQKIIRSPSLVAITAFAIFLLYVYSTDTTLLIFAIVYTILAFVTALITKYICGHSGANGLFTSIQTENIEANNITANTLNVEDANSYTSCRCNYKKY